MDNEVKRSLKLIDFAIKQAQDRSAMNLSLSVASKQRAASTSSILISLATALFGAVIALPVETLELPGQVAGVVTGTILLISGGLCGWILRSESLYGIGSPPKAWIRDIESRIPERVAKIEYLKIVDKHLEHDRKLLERNGHFFNIAISLSFLSPITGFIAYVIVNLCAQTSEKNIPNFL